MKKITVETIINAPIDRVWTAWNEPEHIVHWAFASDDWECPKAENDLRVGGELKTTMAAKDGSSSFDFGGKYNTVVEYKVIDLTMSGDDARNVHTEFESIGNTTKVTETFDMENENSEELQRSGWQAILNNFKSYTESL